MISAKSLSILGLSIQDNASLKQLSLTSNIIQSDFRDFSQSIQISSSLLYLNLSKNQLTDVHGEIICNMIKESCFNTIILDSNQFKTLKFKEYINSNMYLEEFSISYNYLGYDEIINILEVLPMNKNLKILGLQGYNNILYDKMLGEVLKKSLLIVLRYDLTVLDLTVIKEIENTLIKKNKSLVSIESKDIDWDSISGKHPFLQIKRALKANLWLSQNDALPSECNNDIFIDVQDVVIQKQSHHSDSSFEVCIDQINEEEMIALEYDKSPDIIPMAIDKNYKKNAENHEFDEEKSFEKKINKKILQNEEKNREIFFKALEKMETKFDKMMEKVIEKIEKIEEKFDNQKEEVQNMKGIISHKLNTITDQLEAEMKDFSLNHKQNANRIEEKIIQLENREDRKVGLLKEIVDQYESIRESFKDIDVRIDKFEIEKKPLSNAKSAEKNHKEINELSSKQSELLAKIEELQMNHDSISGKLAKIDTIEEFSKKASNKLESFKQDIEEYQKNIETSLSSLEEKSNESLRLKNLVTAFQKETYSKLSSIDCKIVEITDNPKIEEIQGNLYSFESRINLLEEKLLKNYNETAFTLKHRDQLIESRLAYLEQERLNIEELKNKLISKSENESFRETFQQKQERSLNERIASLEKLNFKKKPLTGKYLDDYDNKFIDLCEVLPEEAESFVVNSAIEKANRSREKIMNSKYQEKTKTMRKTAY